jgi:hypothetical protein
MEVNKEIILSKIIFLQVALLKMPLSVTEVAPTCH